MGSSRSALRPTAAVCGTHVRYSDSEGVLGTFAYNSTGFDRDLSIAGRAMIKNADGAFVQKLIKIDRPSTCRAQS